MKILDWYILKKFLKTYVFAVLIIVVIIMVIDYTEKIDDFIRKEAPLRAILVEYYLNFIPYWANYISPLMVFIATVFFTANLAAKTEIIAILSSGVSFFRLMRPYIIGSTAIAVATFVMVGWIVPMANKVRVPFEHKYINGAYYFDKRDIHIKIAPDVYAYLESYDNSLKTGYRFSLEKIKGTDIQIKLMADRITWDSTRNKWQFHDYRIRFEEPGNKRVAFGSQIDSTLNLFPKDFENKHLLHETFTLPELERHIDLVKSRGADGVEVYLIEKYLRFANPFSVIILTVIGFLVSARKSRGGVGFQIALGFTLAFVYILFFMMSKGIAEGGGMPPLLAVWLPNLIFSGIGVVLYYTIPR
ncbi:YjgP/YjgQ family permease [Sandaracinomonas limnophila]|uniref:YjgP/YjgQ family permease n=1 Tax=Sandaracinomonas limnophila TaxID=1862386 RepID=A0A437PUR4_9BACT|nr:LptF/LptG family permease [Sandaracinomonas limnophila]RVU25992.1 YjgP/YjgQ family permease [Sandaracinomonas limnophila]